jgi:ABC-2 type transport system permease protein
MKPFLLARLRLRMTLNRLWPPTPAGSLFALGFVLAGALFVAGDYLFFRRIFENLLATEDIPKVLLTAVAAKLMGLVLLTTLTLLAFSAAVTALSYLYLDEDLSLLIPLPVGSGRLLAQRCAEAGANASYTVALLLAPVIAAYWSLGSRSAFALATGLIGLLLYLAIPLSAGIGITVVLARFFPARRLHQVLTVLSVVMLCMLVVLFRMARPEALLNPESSNQVLEVLRSIRMPSEALLPSTWLAQAVVRGSEGSWTEAASGLGRLAAAAGGSVALLVLLLRLWYWQGYGRAQEQQNMAPDGERPRFGKALLDAALWPVPAGRRSRALLRRDALLFFRDPTQWGQLIILAALVVIYLFNVRYMPTGLAVFKVAVAFWNLATLGLIVSSVAGRFAFTAVGSEGKAYFASRVLPVDVWSYLWAKYLFTAVPLSLLAALTLYGSNRFLGIEGEALRYTVFVAVAASLALSSLALAMGCMRPVFDSRNPAKGVMSTWGLAYMFLSLIYVGFMIVVSARPVYQYYAHLMAKGPEADYRLALVNVGGLSALIVLGSFLSAASRLKRLEAR